VLCCLIGLAALSPVGAWMIARRKAASGWVCRQQDMWVSAAVLAAGMGMAGVAGYLLMAASPESFGPICRVLMTTPPAWPRL